MLVYRRFRFKFLSFYDGTKMDQFDPSLFSVVHRSLFDLYKRSGLPDQTPSDEELRNALSNLHKSVYSSKCQQSKSCFERYVKLLSVSRQDSGLSAEYNLQKPLREKKRTFVEGASDQPDQRILVSGIGRSGTTMIYQQLAKLLQIDGKERINFRYEPYLWSIRSGTTKGNAFGMEQLHQFGLHTHLETPLLLNEKSALHDSFLDSLFAGPSDRDPEQGPDACLTKVIRGSGRLGSYIDRFPDLKVVACLRNPFDTINSSLGMFSFFGEEFHENDRERFLAELNARGLPTEHLSLDSPRSIEWSAAWWQTFTAETLAVARQYPDNVFLFCYEDFSRDGARVMQNLQDFVGIQNDGIAMGLSKPAGPSIKATSLNAWDVAYLQDCHAFYEEEVLRPLLGGTGVTEQRQAIAKKYAQGKFSFPIAGADLGRRAPIQLRGMMLHDGKSPFLTLAKSARTPIDLPALINTYASEDQLTPTAQTLETDLRALKKGKRFGAVITCHNNSTTIVGAVLSCLNQTVPYDRIIVVDDCSTDDSKTKLAVLEEMYSALQVIPLESSLGPSGARHIGISRLDTDYWTQLDGDDLFWPTKNQAEIVAIDGDDNAIAFSDILLVNPNNTSLQPTKTYDGKHPNAFECLLSRIVQIPRDMTMSKELYFRAGGYNLVGHLYEDWDFKLRLAALTNSEWRHSKSQIGTVYNRLTPGLSGVDAGLHARALVLYFFKALGHHCPAPGAVLDHFEKAVAPFQDRHIVTEARKWLKAAVGTNSFDPKPFSDLATSRDTHTASNTTLAETFQKRAQSLIGGHKKETLEVAR
ncbi:Glycosyltransferase involved in cell wall bisynthesis [Shimia sagamensis]|uniref:Glycosyltransferase involved in cell wall bisynthesis n=2 Tax=Shimia sagamensis TaxID=1566352 RepID=A0ABY1NB91_9RHOB|nr:Glycosyltransferase involved in cell wall bisynthesis [Shimia sagamensis]